MAYLVGESAFLRTNRQSYTRFGLFNWAQNYKYYFAQRFAAQIDAVQERTEWTTKNENIYLLKSFVIYLFMTITTNNVYNENLRFELYFGDL